jgi:hypothetical protein
MGFSGGGSNVLKSHTHDGTIVQDGGSLNMDNVTQGGLTAGDLIFSDGVHLQRLALGGSGTVLGTASGTAPTWEPSGAAPVLTVDGQIIFYNSGRTALNIGNQDDILTVSALGFPEWSAPATGGERCYTPPASTPNGIRKDHPLFGVQITDGSSNLIGVTVADVSFYIRKDAGMSPTGSGEARVYDEGGSLVATSTTTVDWATLPAAFTKFTFDISRTIELGDRFVLGGGSTGLSKEVTIDNSDASSNTSFQSCVEYDSVTAQWDQYNAGVSGVKWCYTPA